MRAKKRVRVRHCRGHDNGCGDARRTAVGVGLDVVRVAVIPAIDQRIADAACGISPK